jgi:hypothetical protein
MRMAERYGAERLEAACGRAVAIGSPKYKSVAAILKGGLDKLALTMEVEAKTVVHENIRGGDYFDRGEVVSRSEEEKIEARYLEEERQSIIHESRSGVSEGDARRRDKEVVRLDEWSQEAATGMALLATARMMEPLSALITRAQVLLSMPRVARRIGRRPSDDRGGENTQAAEGVSSSCTSHSTCVATGAGNDGPLHVEREEASSRRCVCTTMMCNIDEECPDRGEV